MARYIDADRMQDFLVETNDVDDWCVNQYNADWISSFIESQPTADVVEVKHGYWEIVKGSNGKEKMVCTNCRHQQDLHSTFTYCPNCGAKMDGKEEKKDDQDS